MAFLSIQDILLSRNQVFIYIILTLFQLLFIGGYLLIFMDQKISHQKKKRKKGGKKEYTISTTFKKICLTEY